MLVSRTMRKDAKGYEERFNARDGARILWIRVIYQAVEDLSHPAQKVKVRAAKFLSGATGALQDICAVIGLNDTVLMQSYKNGKIMELKQNLRQKCL